MYLCSTSPKTLLHLYLQASMRLTECARWQRTAFDNLGVQWKTALAASLPGANRGKPPPHRPVPHKPLTALLASFESKWFGKTSGFVRLASVQISVWWEQGNVYSIKPCFTGCTPEWNLTCSERWTLGWIYFSSCNNLSVFSRTVMRCYFPYAPLNNNNGQF